MQKIASRILWLYEKLMFLCPIGSVVFLLSYVVFHTILPFTVQDVATWLAPESKFGYAEKYDLPESKVYVQPQPHDCEWGKAPIGKKYCHFERRAVTDKDSQGKVTVVYVNWEKIHH